MDNFTEMNYFKLIQRLYALKYFKDKLKHHPEANVLEHSLQTYYIAKRESDDKELWVAALFHDIYKQIETLGHDKGGVEMLGSFGYNNPKVLWLIKNHVRIISFMDGSMKRLKKSKDFIAHPWFLTLVHLRRCDYMGRNKNKESKITSDLALEINNLLEITNENT